MGWSDEQLKKWVDGYNKNVKIYERLGSIATWSNCIFAMITILWICSKYYNRSIIAYVLAINLGLLYLDFKYSRLVRYPYIKGCQIMKQIEEIDNAQKTNNVDTQTLRKILKIEKNIKKYEKFMQKYYEEN